MKLLSNEEVEIVDGVIELVINPITTSVQGRLMEFAMGEQTVSKNVDRTIYSLKNIIKKVTIEGKSYDPIELADNIDIGDRTSRDVFINIGMMVLSRAFMDDETEKKLEQPGKLGSSEGPASNAQDLSEEGNLKKVV